MQLIRLTKKLAPIINGIDLSKLKVGDTVEAPNAVAEILILEGWAEAVPDKHRQPEQS